MLKPVYFSMGTFSSSHVMRPVIHDLGLTLPYHFGFSPSCLALGQPLGNLTTYMYF